MQKEQFDFLCKTIGDQSLPENERWKSIESIHIHGSYEPLGHFPDLLKRDEIYYLDHPVLGPGFFYLATPDPAYKVLNKGHTISWISLEVISEITFLGSDVFNGYETYGISDYISALMGEEVVLPVAVEVSKTRIRRDMVREGDYQLIIGFSRELTNDDYDIIFYDNLGNELTEQPKRTGVYSVLVKCKGKYRGEGRAQYEIY